MRRTARAGNSRVLQKMLGENPMSVHNHGLRSITRGALHICLTLADAHLDGVQGGHQAAYSFDG